MRAFQSTPSAWRETGLPTHVVVCYGISIHSLRMEGDVCPELSHPGQTHYFNPLPPHGGRPNVHKIYFNVRYFNPLPPHGGRRRNYHSRNATVGFQSTPSAWRETVCHSRSPPDWNYFNPLPPHGGRPEREISISVFVSISIHSLRMEGDVGQSTPIQGLRDFNPLPPHGGRPVS